MSLKRALPAPVRQLGRAAYETVRGSLADAAEWAGGERRPLSPPRRLWHLIGSGRMDFHGSADLLRGFLIDNGLTPDDQVLDVGCGLGRMAVALVPYLSARGSYDGFDIMPPVIRWCRTITEAHSNFRFKLVSVGSDRYRRGGATAASAFGFPYSDASFDYAFVGSVFTHMFPAGMGNYLAEIARVMKPGGRAAVSYYLIDAERRAELARGESALSFQHRGDGYWAEMAELPEAAIAYDKDEVLALIDAIGFDIAASYYGEWPTTKLHSQDVVILRKR